MKRENWKVPPDQQPPNKFWTDFGNFVKASMMCDDTDEYWQTLIHWADILMKRYDNTIVNSIVMDYLDGQSRRSMSKIDT